MALSEVARLAPARRQANNSAEVSHPVSHPRLPTTILPGSLWQEAVIVVGKTLGHYEIIEPLGKGGMEEVYRARSERETS